MKAPLLIVLGLVALACGATAGQSVKVPIKPMEKAPMRKDRVVKTEAQWKKVLSPAAFEVLRKDGTDPAFDSPFHDNHAKGDYYCAGCGLLIFSSDNKFDSGTGWPSFWKPIKLDNVWYRRDGSAGMDRIEVRCARCDGHLGHVFDDGPQPTGLRYCLNGSALKFVKK